MSNKRGHSELSSGDRGGLQSSAGRRPSTKGSSFALENTDGAATYEAISLNGRRASKSTDGAESDGSSDQPGRTRKKAEPVKSACVQCQKRKTKCSGQRPVCRFCRDRSLECSWDISDGLTRTADLKRKLQEAVGRSDDLDTLVNAMRQGSDEVSTMLLAKLRCGFTIEDIVSEIRNPSSPLGNVDTQSEPSHSQSTERKGSYHSSASGDNSSPTTSAQTFDWPSPNLQLHQTQSGDKWDADGRPYQPPGSQSFLPSKFDQPRMAWPNINFCSPVGAPAQLDTNHLRDQPNTIDTTSGVVPPVRLVPKCFD